MTKFKEFEERKREVSRRGKGDGNPIPMVKKETEISSGKGSWDMSTDRRGTAIVINLFPMYWLPAKRDAVIDMWLWILPPRTFYRFHHLSTADATTYTTTCLENRVKDFRSVHNSAKLNVLSLGEILISTCLCNMGDRWRNSFAVSIYAQTRNICKFLSRSFFI